MSARQLRYCELQCDKSGCRAGFRGNLGESRAAVRRRAARDGWAHEHRDGYPRYQDKDFCPEHKPSGGDGQ